MARRREAGSAVLRTGSCTALPAWQACLQETPMPDARNRILLVDDDPTVLRAYTKVLTSHGWKVEAAPDGKQAIEHLRGAPFGAIVSDVSMPQMGGLDFLRVVRE